MLLQVNALRGEWPFLLVCFSAFLAVSHGTCGEPPKLDLGILADEFIGQSNFSVDAVVTYNCIPGYVRIPGTKNSLVCLANSTWSTADIFCQRRSCGHPGTIDHGEMHFEDFLFGSRVNYTCNVGYNMMSKKDYRDCQANGMWSNAVPICEIQICPPPLSIADGDFEPQNEEYVYQDAVTYRCIGKNFALLGESVLSCTADGRWSSDAPKCKAVQCENPTVLNAKKVSGFAGPYYYESAVQFECLSEYKMNGSSLVRCNASSQWEPPLPTCYRDTATTTPITSKEPTKGETTTTTTTTTTPITSREPAKGETTTTTTTPITSKEPTKGETTATTAPIKEPTKDNDSSGSVIAGKLIVTLTMFIMGHVLSNLF